jgi:hypothetical protein
MLAGMLRLYLLCVYLSIVKTGGGSSSEPVALDGWADYLLSDTD